MDPSILKLLEEDKDDSKDDVVAFQASLNRQIQGCIISQVKNQSSSQQFATGNNGFGDANTNLHILESTLMKEQQQPSVSGNQNRESQSQHNPPQDHLQTGQLLENPSLVPQASNLQSGNNPFSNEPERPQPLYPNLQEMSSQRDHGVAGPVLRGPEKANICELLRILTALVDEDGKMPILNLYYQVKREEITKEGLIRHLRHVVDDKHMRLAMSKIRKLEQGNKGIEVPGRPNHYGESFTSAEISAKKSDLGGVYVNQLPCTSSGTLSSSAATVQGLHNFERPTFVDGLSSAQSGPISHFQSNSSLLMYSAPCQGSVTKDQTMGPSSSMVHVKQKSIDPSSNQAQEHCSLGQQVMSNIPMKQRNGNPWRSNDDLEMQSSRMVFSTSTTQAGFVSPSVKTHMNSSATVNFPAPSGTIPARVKVRKTPNKPSVSRKKPLEALGSSLPPSSKKQKICKTSLNESMEQFNDVTALSGINLEEEGKKLLLSGDRKHGHVSVASRRIVHEEEERTIVQKVPLQRKLAEIMAKSGLKHIKDDVERCLSLCVEERMRGLLSNIIRLSKQRTNANKCRNRTCVTSDIRKQINEMNQKAKEEWERKHGGDGNLKNEENDTAKEDARSEQVKANKEEAAKRTKAANVAALAAVGGDDTFSKWKLMAEARQRPSSGTGRNSKKPYAETGGKRIGKKQGSPKVVRSISVKDVIVVVEREPQMSRSTLLYRLYDRIFSDVPTQEKT